MMAAQWLCISKEHVRRSFVRADPGEKKGRDMMT